MEVTFDTYNIPYKISNMKISNMNIVVQVYSINIKGPHNLIKWF